MKWRVFFPVVMVAADVEVEVAVQIVKTNPVIQDTLMVAAVVAADTILFIKSI
jgi:hypothetical protein